MALAGQADVPEALDALDATANEELRKKLTELTSLSDKHEARDEDWHHGFGCGVGRAVNDMRELVDMTMSEKYPRNVHLKCRLPANGSDAVAIYERNPIVAELVKQYADRTDCTVEDVLTENTSDIIGAPAPVLGYQTVAAVERARERLADRGLDADVEHRDQDGDDDE